MNVDLITVPFDSGMRDTRMGRGPAHLIELGLIDELRSLDAHARVARAEPPVDVFPSETRMAFELQRGVARAVADALARRSFPLVLSGNCNTAVGTVAALRAARERSPAVCWFDAHADFNTPDTTMGGFLDGMSVSMLTGHCWRALTAQVDGFAPTPDANVLLIGVRDVDPLEQELLDHSAVRVAATPATIAGDIDALAARSGSADVYLHLDLDVLDASEGCANSYAIANGLSRASLSSAIDAIGARFRIGAAAITAYDPACDTTGSVGRIAIDAALRIVRAAASL